MTKKLILFLGCMFLLFQAYACEKTSLSKCAFCDQNILNAQKFYEDDLVYALYTYKPIFPAHLLVLPKRHVERFENLSSEEILRIGEVIKKVDQVAKKVFETSAYMLMQKNGREVCQTVPHVHIHYIGRKKGDTSAVKFVIRMFVFNALSPISSKKMKETVDSLKEAMKAIS